MAFFNEPLFIISPLGDSTIEANVSVEIPFYFSDVNGLVTINDITSLEFYAYTKDGRTTTNITNLSDVTLVLNNAHITYTHTGTSTAVYFMFKVTYGTTVYWISTDAFNIIKTGV